MQSSLPPSYFDALYSANPDPWKFETSEYEAHKYRATIAALPSSPYRSAFEIGGSIGVLTVLLADHCEALLSIDVSEIAQQQAIQRCQDLPHVRFALMRVPQQYPNEVFDLVVLSEVGYYWCWEDLAQAQQQIVDSLEPGGHLVLVHWTQPAPDYPLTGDAVHESFLQCSNLRPLKSQRQEKYRLDVLERI